MTHHPHGLWAELGPSFPWRGCPAPVGTDPAGVVAGVSCCSPSWPPPLLTVSLIPGYFLEDFVDMLCNQKLHQSWELLFHHSVVSPLAAL